MDSKLKECLIARRKPLFFGKKKQDEEEKLAEASNQNVGRSEFDAPELSVMTSFIKKDADIPSKRGSILLPESAK